MLHIRNLRGFHHSPKMTKNTPKIEVFPLALLKSGSNHFAAALNSYPCPICKYILSHSHSGRLHHIFVTPVAPSKTQNDQKHLQSKWLKLFCGCPKFLPRLNLPHLPISAISREATPHFCDPRGPLLSLKMTKPAHKLNAIPSSIFKEWMDLSCRCPKFLSTSNMPLHPILSTCKEANPHIHDPRVANQSPKIMKKKPQNLCMSPGTFEK